MQDSCKNSIAEIMRIVPQQGSKECEKGVVIRRNRKYLRKTKEQFNPYNAPEDTNIKPNDTSEIKNIESENKNIETNHKQTTTEDETPNYSRYGRQLTKPSWMKDFATT